MRRSPEVYVAGLRRRKRRVVQWLVVAVTFGGPLVVNLYGAVNGYSLLRDGLAIQPAIVEILALVTFLQTMAIFCAVGLGLAVAMFIIELTQFTKNDLLVELWDRVQALEESRPAPANNGRPPSPPATDQPGD